MLGWAPFVWVGQRSYAIYLWHWPILMLTRPRVDVSLHGPVLIGLQVAAILLLSDLSFRYIERPIRARRLPRVLPRRDPARRPRPARAPRSAQRGDRDRRRRWSW